MDMKITFPGNVRVNAEIGGLVVQTDQPMMAGGDGSAPSPFTLFLASLGTCAGFYIASFLNSRHIPTDQVSLTQRNEFDPQTHQLTGVKLIIETAPEFPAKYHNALIRAAAMCAVKKTLENPPQIDVEVIGGDMRQAVNE